MLLGTVFSAPTPPTPHDLVPMLSQCRVVPLPVGAESVLSGALPSHRCGLLGANAESVLSGALPSVLSQC